MHVQNYRARTTDSFRIELFELPKMRRRTSPKTKPADAAPESARRRRNLRLPAQPLKLHFERLLQTT